MSEAPVISVIVPVYNAERYLRECIESILSQSFTDFELILVDDGSIDSSPSICDEYSSKDARLSSVHDINKGVSAARERGFRESKGDYICFVDADDRISRDYLKMLYSAASDMDVVYTGEMDEVISGESFAKKLLCNKIKWFLHGKLYHRDVFREDELFVPREYYIGEDLIINIRLANNIKNVRCIDFQGYHYREHEGSVTHTCKVSLEYEERFIEIVERSLGQLSARCHNEMWLFKLRYIMQMIQTRKPIERSKPWVQEALSYKGNIKIGWGERIVLNVPNFKVCYLLLRLKKYLVASLRTIKK